MIKRDEEQIRLLDAAYNYNEAALYYDPATFVDVTDIGDMDRLCPHGDALTFPNKRKGICYNNGKLSMPPLPSTPGALLVLELFSGDHPLSQHFLNNIQKFNELFKFTSFDANVHLTVMTDDKGNRAMKPNCKVLGQIYRSFNLHFINKTFHDH